MIEAVLRRDRLLVIVALALVTILAWAWILSGAGTSMDAGMAMTVAPWSARHAGIIFLMWWIMMAAMMLPSASPVILLAGAVYRRARPSGSAAFSAALAAGYLAAWGGFSLAATLLQWRLETAGLASPATMALLPTLAGFALVAVGLYQFTPLKHACLRHCRAPVHFITRHFRPGAAAGFRMGIIHGAVCVGCCWALMILLFVGGVMNPVWIGGIALYVLAEKLAPRGIFWSRAGGVLLVAAGILVLWWKF